MTTRTLLLSFTHNHKKSKKYKSLNLNLQTQLKMSLGSGTIATTTMSGKRCGASLKGGRENQLETAKAQRQVKKGSNPNSIVCVTKNIRQVFQSINGSEDNNLTYRGYNSELYQAINYCKQQESNNGSVNLLLSNGLFSATSLLMLFLVRSNLQ